MCGLDLGCALPRGRSTLRHPGSPTTSPDTAGLSRPMRRERAAVAPETAAGFRELFPDDDARDLRPLNGRVVRLREQ